jgi:hypothetical protein
LIVTCSTVLAGKRQEIVSRTADVMIGIWVVLGALLWLLGLLVVVVLAIHSCCYPFRLGCRCVRGWLVEVSVMLSSSAHSRLLEVGSARCYASTLEVKDGLCVRARGWEHGTAAAGCKSSAQRRLVGRREASKRLAKVVRLSSRATQHSRAQRSCAQ